MLIGLAFFALVATVLVIVLSLSAAAKRPRRAVIAGFSLTAIFTLIFAAFIVGDTFDDPGGWQAAGLVAAWLIPLAGLATLAWYRPAWATPVLGALTAVAIGLSIWLAVDPGLWRTFENQHGPIRAILTFVLTAPLAVLGLRLTAEAGVLLIIVGVIPFELSASKGIGGLGSLAIASAVPVLTGVLYVLAAVLARWSARSCGPDADGDDASGDDASGHDASRPAVASHRSSQSGSRVT